MIINNGKRKGDGSIFHLTSIPPRCYHLFFKNRTVPFNYYIYISVENPVLASGNTVVLTAAAENQIASFYPEAEHGLFTYFFLKGLRGDGDLDGDGWVELKELFDYLTPEVTAIARRMNREQTPVILPSIEILAERAEYRLTKAK